MNKLLFFRCLGILSLNILVGYTVFAQGSNSGDWTVHKPFEHDVFIENKGQFIGQVKKGVGEKILYYTHKGQMHIYFTASGLTFEYDSAYRDKGADDIARSADDKDAGIKILPAFMHIKWEGSNAEVQAEAQNEVNSYFTYVDPSDKMGNKGILAHAWKKLVYHNIYKNIDIEFYYPEDGSGLEYDIIVHPGGNLRDVKMSYSGDAKLSLIKNTIHIISPCSDFSDRAPIAHEEGGKGVSAQFVLENNTVTFTSGKYDKSKTLVIDPMLSTTSFTGTNKAYDLQYDLAGNVYVMGGGDKTEFQMQKYSPAGALLWTYTSTFAYTFKSAYYYGGFTTDDRSGSSYIAEGLDFSGSGCLIEKINASGILVKTYPGSSDINEIWRLAYDYCDNQLIIGAGEGTNAVFQGATLDTNFNKINAVNVLGAPPGSTHHDIAMIAFDGVGKCYFATTKPASNNYTGYENVLLQMPAGTLAPTAYQVDDRSLFVETASIPYYPVLLSPPYIYSGNGFNGLIADLNIVATYDGHKLRTWTPNTGAIIDSTTVTPQTQLWGGIAMDCEENIYVANVNKVSEYSSKLSLLNTLTLTSNSISDTIYDFHIAPNNNLYACGNDFVSATAIIIPKMVTTTSTPPKGCGCTGAATATVCDNYAFTYSWSNGATTSSVSGLCPGKYIVTIKDASCIPRQDTSSVTILGSPGGLSLTTTESNPKCFGSNTGSATVVVNGGSGPYTYAWSPNGGSGATATGLSAGTYTVLVTDVNGCSHDTTVVIIAPPQLTDSITATTNLLCSGANTGSAAVGVKGGTSPYNYSWTPSGGTNAAATSLTAGTYTVTVTDQNGCIVSASAIITQPPPLVISTQTQIACPGKPVTLTPGYSGGTPAYSYNWLPNINLNCNTCANPVASPNVTTVYTVTVTDAHGCTSTATDTVMIAPPLNIIAGTSQAICPGSSVTLNVKANGGNGVYTYNWSPAASLSCTGCQNPVATPAITTTYTVIVNDGCGTFDSAFVTITVNPLPAVSFSADTLNGCAPLCVNFTDLTTVALGKASSWKWNFGDGDSSALENPHHCYTKAGVYIVTLSVTSDSGCTSSLVVSNMITVYSKPVANFTFGPQPTIILAPTIYFTDESTDTYGIASWLWTFGDGIDVPSILKDPSHKYSDTGTYCATLRVTNIHGCVDSITECLVISPEFAIWVPNAFSPNSDGLNDIFTAKGVGILTFQMWIFDRWGMKLYYTDDINKGWDGIVQGGASRQVAQEDTYVWLIKATDIFHNNHRLIGRVTLIK